MSTAQPNDAQKPKRTNLIALGVAIVLAFVLSRSCTSEPKPSTEQIASSASSAATERPTPSSPRTSSTWAAPSTSEVEEEKDAMPWLRSQFDAAPMEVFLSDPSIWYGYVAGAYVEGSRLHVQLQVDRKADKALGEDAAKAIASLASFAKDPVLDGVDWVLVEDGTGTIIKQEQVRG